MHVVDTCGWLEWFTDGDLADRYQPFLRNPADILVPTLIVYEVYKILKRETGEENALLAIARLQESKVVALDTRLALQAADAALDHRLAMADAIIYATAMAYQCTVVTSDGDLQHLGNIRFIPKP